MGHIFCYHQVEFCDWLHVFSGHHLTCKFFQKCVGSSQFSMPFFSCQVIWYDDFVYELISYFTLVKTILNTPVTLFNYETVCGHFFFRFSFAIQALESNLLPGITSIYIVFQLYVLAFKSFNDSFEAIVITLDYGLVAFRLQTFIQRCFGILLMLSTLHDHYDATRFQYCCFNAFAHISLKHI